MGRLVLLYPLFKKRGLKSILGASESVQSILRLKTLLVYYKIEVEMGRGYFYPYFDFNLFFRAL